MATAFRHLPGRETVDASERAERARDRQLLRTRLTRLVARHPAVAQAIVATVAEINLASAGDELHAVIEAQAYRLAYWRAAADEINEGVLLPYRERMVQYMLKAARESRLHTRWTTLRSSSLWPHWQRLIRRRRRRPCCQRRTMVGPSCG